jgi:hypothetical protein
LRSCARAYPWIWKGLQNLNLMLAPAGILILQVQFFKWIFRQKPNSRRQYPRVSSFRHCCSLDISDVKVFVGLLDFQITSPEIRSDKYEFLLNNRERCIILGDQLIKLFGLGIPDLCEAFIAYKK